MTAGLIVLIILIVFLFIVAASGVRIVPQARAGIVERLGRYSRTLDPGLTLIVPFIDRVKPLIDLREQVVSFPPQPVITEDNLVVGIDTVIYFTVTDPQAATYEVANPLQAIEQLSAVLDDATGRWGIRVNRVELKSVEPPRTVQEAMEKQMRAERDRRATILTAEGQRTSAILKAEGEAKAIETVFSAIHDGAPDQALLSYQYLQMLPQLAQGSANKVFVIPSEFSQALTSIAGRFGGAEGIQPQAPKPARRRDLSEIDAQAAADAEDASRAAREATEPAESASTPGIPPIPPSP